MKKNKIDEPFFLFRWFIDTKNRTVGITTDILNYIFIWRTIRRCKKTEQWKNLNLRFDYLGRIYTVVSLRAEDFGENDPQIRESRYREKSEPIYQYLTGINLHEIVSPEISHIPVSYSYLVKFVPIFNSLTFGWFLWFVIRIAVYYGIFYLLNSIFDFQGLWQHILFYLKLQHIIK